VDCQRDEHRMHLIFFYHLMWTSKHRKALLVGEIERDCRALIQQTCRDTGTGCGCVVTGIAYTFHGTHCMRCVTSPSARG